MCRSARRLPASGNRDTETDLAVQDITLAQMLAAKRLPGDVVIFPSGQIGDLAERGLIEPLDEEHLSSTEFDRRDIFPLVRLRETTWASRTFAVPLGSPQLLLIYLPALHQAGIEPPKTWPEYQAACEKLAASSKPAAENVGRRWPTIEPLAEGWAGQTLLARAASYVTHRDQVSSLFDYETMEPLIATPPYVRALSELVTASQHFPPGVRVTPAEAVERVYEGQAAMAIGWFPPVRPRWTGCPFPPEVALLPGSTSAYNFANEKWEERNAADSLHVPLLAVAGRMGAVTSTASRPREAANFLVWLSSSKTSAAAGPSSAGTTLFRDSQMPDAQRWVANSNNARGYAQALQEAHSLPRHLALRMPGRERYLQALDAAVWSAIGGEMSPEEALSAAAQQWVKINAELGTQSQQQANRRDLGTLSLP